VADRARPNRFPAAAGSREPGRDRRSGSQRRRRRVCDRGRAERRRAPGRSIGPITIRYVRDGQDIADPSRWSPGFAEAFAFRLAWQISDPLSADKGRKDRAENSYAKALRKARKSNARTKPFRRNPRSDWARARHVCRTDRFIR
jgi:hypothetical protein